MKKLNQKEINFIKETNFTVTVFQCDEYNRTPFKDFDEACRIGRSKYKVSVRKILAKLNDRDDIDSISADFNAVYLFYTFFTEDELAKLSPADGLKWLQDFKYHFGFRKWTEDMTADEIYEALEIYKGTREFYTDRGHMWNRSIK